MSTGSAAPSDRGAVRGVGASRGIMGDMTATDHRPPPPTVGHPRSWAATHPFLLALLAGVAATVASGWITLTSRGESSTAEAVAAALFAGSVFGGAAYLGQRPVRRERQLHLGLVLAVVPWVILVGFDADLFAGTVVIAFVTAIPLLSNHQALRRGEDAARLRRAGDLPSPP